MEKRTEHIHAEVKGTLCAMVKSLGRYNEQQIHS